MRKHWGSGRGFCNIEGCFEYTTKSIWDGNSEVNHYFCDKHADEFIFSGVGTVLLHTGKLKLTELNGD